MLKSIKNYLISSSLLTDLTLGLAIGAFSLFHIFFYVNAEYLNTFYQDWMVHAFRIKLLQDYGLISWSHIWGNGISIWRAYQFVPHLLTLGLINLLHLSITRGMIVITILLFILMRFFIYIILRILKFSPLTAFFCVLLSFDIAQFWGGVADYSIMFGFAFFPLVLGLWILYTKGKLQNVFPYLTGLVFYIHPLLGIFSFGLWAITLFQFRRALLSLENLKQLVIILLSSSLFWLPIIYKPSFSYTSSNLASKYFLQLVLTAYDYYGLSLAIIASLIISSFQIFFPLSKKMKWVRYLSLFSLTFFGLIILATSIDLPRIVGQLQITRGATLIGISTLFLIAPVIQWLLNRKNMLINAALTCITVLIAADGLWLSSAFSPQIKTIYEEPISGYLAKNPQSELKEKRVWTPEIGVSSYSGPNTLRLPYSYMSHLDSNQISTRMYQLLSGQAYVGNIPQENINRVNDYMKISATKYAFFEESSPFTQTLSQKNSQYENLGKVNFPRSIYHLFAMPWASKNAAIIDSRYLQNLKAFPKSLVLEKPADQIELDTLVNKFTNTIYAANNQPLNVNYPTQDQLTVEIPNNRNSEYIYIAESYDSEWHGEFNGKEVEIQASGPNYILVTLPDKNSKGDLLLKHTWPPTYYFSWTMIIALPFMIFAGSIFSMLETISFGTKLKFIGTREDISYLNSD